MDRIFLYHFRFLSLYQSLSVSVTLCSFMGHVSCFTFAYRLKRDLIVSEET